MEENIQKTAEEQEVKTFTQEQVNALVGEARVKARSQFADYEELKKKAAQFDEMQEANKSELQKATEKAAALQSKLDALNKENDIRKIREKVAEETKVPVSMLTFDTEEACTAQAKSILEFTQQNKDKGYPSVKDGGEVLKTKGATSTREQFAEWLNQAF